MSDPAMDVMHGIEKSRKAGWAFAKKCEDKIVTLLKVNQGLQNKLAALAVAIAYDETLRVLDPDGELVHAARRTIASLRSNPRGQVALRKAMENREVD